MRLGRCDPTSMPRSPAPPNDRSARTTGRRFERLVEIMRTLRSPEGCPWDRVQTLATLRPFVLEEAYEVLDALDRKDIVELKGELGDLLFQVIFLAQLTAESKDFTIDDALDAISAKLVRRHPHVFGDPDDRDSSARLTTAGEVRGRWEELKAGERADAGRSGGLLGGVPTTLPSLLRAFEIGSRVSSVGFDWPSGADVVEKIEEEVAELRQAVEDGTAGHQEEEMGDLLFSIANLSRKLGIEPEAALRQANRKFCERFNALERRLTTLGKTLQEATPKDMEAAWQYVKGLSP